MSEPTQAQANPARDWTSLALGSNGRSLIEASAGTGKTWTISMLYLRALLEPRAQGLVPLTPRQIVVATFSDAAAQELRARIRERLRWAEQLAFAAIETGASSVVAGMKPDAAWLHARWNGMGNATRRDHQRLRLALAELDVAPIGTLHSLCRRILTDYPFESGSTFRMDELVSGAAIHTELAEDLWRRVQQGKHAPPPLKSIESLAALTKRLKLCLLPGVGLWAPDADDLEHYLPAKWADRITTLAERKDIWGRAKNAPDGLRELAVFLRDTTGSWSQKQSDNIDQAREHLAAQPDFAEEHAFLVNAVRLLGYRAASTDIRAWQTWTQQMRDLRDARSAASGVLSYDDLLVRVDAALRDDSHALADRLFGEWPLALIDEFQDTDGLQYAIIDRIYRDADGAPRGRLILIGDPKQAIYRFRGGDIDTYLHAARNVDATLELDTNFRSSRAYVAALDEWFARGGTTLSTTPKHPIAVHAVSASDRRDKTPYRTPNEEAAHPLVLHFNAQAPTSAPARQHAALTACANQIAAMLNDAHYGIGDRRVEPGDIAVLLPTNPQILALRKLLQERHVPCAGAGKSSVFETEWAREVQIALYAVEHANDDGAIRAALATRLGGLDFAQLRQLDAAHDQWSSQVQRFAGLKRRWQRDGVLAVVLDFAHHAMTRLAERAERERALADLRHLGELLQAQSAHGLGGDGLLAWLAAQRRGEGDEGDAADEQQLRIESDARRVRLMTLHASKGLEFPIVFLPLLWDHTPRSDTPVIHERLCGQRVIGFGSEAKAQFEHEGQDERFRVLYVALTRAVYACHVWALPPGRPADARPNSKPRRDPQRSALDAMIDHLQTQVPDLTSLQHVHWIQDNWLCPRTSYVSPIATPPQAFKAWPEPTAAAYVSTWSFSALTSHRHAPTREDAAADDEHAGVELAAHAAPAPTAPHAGLAELAMLRGTEFGNALHAIFECRRLDTPLAAQSDLIVRALRDADVRLGDLPLATAVTRIAMRLDATLAAELAPGLRLGAIAANRQRAEMAFHFVLDAVSIPRLREVCARHDHADLIPVALAAVTLRGMMTGKIDLIFAHDGRFHVLDYKSNQLGDSLDAYAPAALTAAMDAHSYRFQALLYTLAVDRYLRQRLPDYRRDRDLGDAIYLFVRAAGFAPGAGVWRHRFDVALIAAIDAVFTASTKPVAA